MNVIYESIGPASAYLFCAAADVAVAGLVSFVVLACLACFFAGFFELFAAGALLCVAGVVCPSRAVAKVGIPKVSARTKVAIVANIFFMVQNLLSGSPSY
jgi:hypothetical protein